MRIVLVHFYSDQPTPVYDQLARIMRQQEHTVWVGTPNPAARLVWSDGKRIIAVQDGPKPMPKRVQSIPLVRWLWRRVAALSFMLRVRGFLRQAGPDIVQINPASVSGTWVIPVLMPVRMRFVLDIRQAGLGKGIRNWGVRDGFRILILRLWSRFIYDWTCFVDESTAQSVLGRQWIRQSSAIPMGVSRHFVEYQPPRTRHGSCSDLVRFVYLGRLNRARRIERLLLAVRRTLQKADHFRVVLLGPEDEPGLHANMVRDLRLDSVVTVQPPVNYERVPETVTSCDVALAYVPDLPDWRLQPSAKILEYRALGLPILATDIAPNRELVEQEVNGLLVPDSVDGLAAGMLRFITDRDLLQRCKAKAQSMRQVHVTWEEVGNLQLKMYRNITLGGQAAPSGEAVMLERR